MLILVVLHVACAQEAEVTRLSGIEAVADRLRGQLAAADASLSERDSTVQLLTADKAYLSKEVQVRMRTVDSWPLPWCLCRTGHTASNMLCRQGQHTQRAQTPGLHT